jgi:hypothetical protein
MKFENQEVWGFEHALRGMRNPLESWSRSDSSFPMGEVFIGPNDLKLAQTLIKAGSEHRKFLRQIFVSVDITAPLFYWKEFDTYKIGTTANSTSTMHKLLAHPITEDCFETDGMPDLPLPEAGKYMTTQRFVEDDLITFLELLRKKSIEETNAGRKYTGQAYWMMLVRWLPESWLQTRTVTLNYENLLSMYHQRKNHKLKEWRVDFCNWVKTLPYATTLLIDIE